MYFLQQDQTSEAYPNSSINYNLSLYRTTYSNHPKCIQWKLYKTLMEESEGDAKSGKTLHAHGKGELILLRGLYYCYEREYHRPMCLSTESPVVWRHNFTGGNISPMANFESIWSILPAAGSLCFVLVVMVTAMFVVKNKSSQHPAPVTMSACCWTSLPWWWWSHQPT